MEPSTDLKPMISIIVPAMLGYDSVLAALDSWEAQHCRDELEILVLCPTGPNHPIPPGHVVVETGSMRFTRRGPPESAEPQRTS
jgi:hypothetical protein